MIYKDFKGKKLSQLGFGAMRLPIIDGDFSKIDKGQTKEMVAYAMEQGINYYDTAWGYHNGMSETVMGELLSEYPRDSFYLASKFPGYDLANMGKAKEIFEEQLKKCRVDHFDFYLIHNVCELNIDAYLDESYGTLDYFLEQKRRGRIDHLGFSAHGSYEVIERFLKAYGEHMEFCQLQINWVDWTFQKAKEKADLAASYGLAVWVMEPLRGGSLASLPETDEAKLKALRPDEKIPAWSFRFLQSLPNIPLILGGMSTYEQLVENITTFEEAKPLNEEEMAALGRVAASMVNKVGLACTECRYCVEYCSQSLDIPLLIGLYNQRSLTGENDFIAPMALSSLPADQQPSNCTSCRSCEEVCPQQLDIADAMKDFAKMVG